MVQEYNNNDNVWSDYVYDFMNYPESVNNFLESCEYQSGSKASESEIESECMVGKYIFLTPIEKVDPLSGCCDNFATELWDYYLPQRAGEKRKKVNNDDNFDNFEPSLKKRRKNPPPSASDIIAAKEGENERLRKDLESCQAELKYYQEMVRQLQEDPDMKRNQLEE